MRLAASLGYDIRFQFRYGFYYAYLFISILYILIITPVYFTTLLIIGSLFGQFRFFWEFEKKMFLRFRKKSKPENEKPNQNIVD